MVRNRRVNGMAFAAVLMSTSSGSVAEVMVGKPPARIEVTALYKSDAVAVVRGGLDRDVRLLGNAELIAEADLSPLVGWRGGRAKVHLLGVHGGMPNEGAGTIQGIDNIEAPHDRLKLYEFWLEQSAFGDRASMRVGMADLNADFYQNDAAGLLIAPAFGIGSEIAASGPNGPSIFPSTALSTRVRIAPFRNSYVQAALFNAKAGVVGDRDGVDLAMRDGALAIAEAGMTGSGKLAIGFWRYTKRQDDIRTADMNGHPAQHIAQGAYVVGERQLLGAGKRRQLSVFARAGLSDADTSPYRGGAQAGLLVSGVFGGRPESQLSFGINQAYLSRKFRANAADEGMPLGRAETGFELTYSDQLLPSLTLQPDLQYIRNPSANPAIEDALVMGLRIMVTAPVR